MKKKISDKLRLEAIKLYNTTNLNQNAIGKKINCSEGTIRVILKEAGIEYNREGRKGIKEEVRASALINEEATAKEEAVNVKDLIKEVIDILKRIELVLDN